MKKWFLFSLLVTFVAGGHLAFAQLKVVADGNVGIGTANPQAKLDLRGILSLNRGRICTTNGPWRTTAIVQINPDSAGRIYSGELTPNRDMRFLQYGDGAAFGAGISWSLAPDTAHNTFLAGSYSSAQYLLYSKGIDLRLDAGNTTVGQYPTATSLANIMTWKGNGNIGINDSLPQEKLSVNAPIRIGSALNIDYDKNMNFYGYYWNSYIDSLTSKRISSGWWSGKASRLVGSGNNLQFDTAFVFADTIQWKNVFTINGNGNVGIGTATPSEKLQVNGSIRTNGYKASDGRPGINASIPIMIGSTTHYFIFKNGILVKDSVGGVNPGIETPER